MKLRIKGNSIRMRLTRSEIDYFRNTGSIEEKTEFGNSLLSYALIKVADIKHLSATFKENKIFLNLPESLAEQWTETELTGIEHALDIGNGKKLFLLLEKDFKCMDQVAEDQHDNYENPLRIKK